MAEPLKNHFGPDVPKRLAESIVRVHPAFDSAAFVSDCLDGFEPLELMDRGRHIASALGKHLPASPPKALEVLVTSLGPEIPDPEESHGMAPFFYMPHVTYVSQHGLNHLPEAFAAQEEMTKRFSCEFSIRPFIQQHEQETLAQLREWTSHPNVHVRRLVSEGTRPRLPWASRLPKYQKDPAPVLELLELLKDDSEEYVRRSVANNLNDIAKDHPDLVVKTAAMWWKGADRNRQRLVRHGLRTLIKQGHPGALEILGFGPNSPASITRVAIKPSPVPIGGKIKIEIELTNPTKDQIAVLVDLQIHFMKANGLTSPKVFKGKEFQLEPGASASFAKTISVKQHTTRKHYPGTHPVDVLINGVVTKLGSFDIAG